MSAEQTRWPLTERFEEAVQYAIHVHEGQTRKGRDAPYISHLFTVAALVMEEGGSEDQVIAALLHDAAEDQGGQERLDAIGARFGEHIAHLVEQCSDRRSLRQRPERGLSKEEDSLKRKREYIEDLRRGNVSDEALLISAADKVHNARAMLGDYRQIGDEMWGDYNIGEKDQLAYYDELVEIYRERGVGRLADELEVALAELRELARDDDG